MFINKFDISVRNSKGISKVWLQPIELFIILLLYKNKFSYLTDIKEEFEKHNIVIKHLEHIRYYLLALVKKGLICYNVDDFDKRGIRNVGRNIYFISEDTIIEKSLNKYNSELITVLLDLINNKSYPLKDGLVNLNYKTAMLLDEIYKHRVIKQNKLFVILKEKNLFKNNPNFLQHIKILRDNNIIDVAKINSITENTVILSDENINKFISEEFLLSAQKLADKLYKESDMEIFQIETKDKVLSILKDDLLILSVLKQHTILGLKEIYNIIKPIRYLTMKNISKIIDCFIKDDIVTLKGNVRSRKIVLLNNLNLRTIPNKVIYN